MSNESKTVKLRSFAEIRGNKIVDIVERLRVETDANPSEAIPSVEKINADVADTVKDNHPEIAYNIPWESWRPMIVMLYDLLNAGYPVYVSSSIRTGFCTWFTVRIRVKANDPLQKNNLSGEMRFDTFVPLAERLSILKDLHDSCERSNACYSKEEQ